MNKRIALAIAAFLTMHVAALTAQSAQSSISITGLSVTPHFMLDSMRYAKDPEPATGARVQLFLRNENPANTEPLVLDKNARIVFEGKSPAELLERNDWSWHDTPLATPDETALLPPGAMTVWTFNSRTPQFGPGSHVHFEAGPETKPWLKTEIAIDKPECWLSAVTFLGPDTAIQPEAMIVHVANAMNKAVEIRSCRMWLPKDPLSPHVLFAQSPLESLQPFNGHSSIPAGEHGGFSVKTGPLPLTYTVVEVVLARPSGETFSLWAYLRIKPERFDISGGWVNGGGNLAHEVSHKALKRLYVNTAHLQLTPGYSDTPLYEKYPLKYFGSMTPLETYDTDAMLPKIHAVECLGEPQYGGGKPVPPQEVWDKLHPYAVSRLATTLTHSEERVWRDYAGLSDFPHYDAYRVTAPSADAWGKYERWGKKKIGWGAPLETIGDMCRSLRELNRPMPCAIWSQGPHEGWGRYGARKRTSPTPDEIRMQAYHAVSTRITSLYWFNLSLKTLVKWRDTLDEVGRIGRELRMIDEFLLEGDAIQFERITNGKKLDWDIASVCGPRAALLFALDLDYAPDYDERVFKFGDPRKANWQFPLPAYLQGVKDVFRWDADGVYDTDWSLKKDVIAIQETTNRVALYIATPDPTLREKLENKRLQLVAAESALQFDPAHNDADFDQLVQLLESIK